MRGIAMPPCVQAASLNTVADAAKSTSPSVSQRKRIHAGSSSNGTGNAVGVTEFSTTYRRGSVDTPCGARIAEPE